MHPIALEYLVEAKLADVERERRGASLARAARLPRASFDAHIHPDPAERPNTGPLTPRRAS